MEDDNFGLMFNLNQEWFTKPDINYLSPTVNRYRIIWDSQGKIMMDEILKLILSKKHVPEILQELHNGSHGEHLSINKTL